MASSPRRRSRAADSLPCVSPRGPARSRLSRRLFFEILEGRRLFANSMAVSFQYDSPGPVTSLSVGQTFELEVYVQDTSSTPTGVFQTYLNLSYASSLANATGAISHGPDYNAAVSGSTSAGTVTDAGGEETNGVTQWPAGSAELLFEIPMVADAAGTLSLTSSLSSNGNHQPLLYGVDGALSLSQISFSNTSITIASAPSPPSAPVLETSEDTGPFQTAGVTHVTSALTFTGTAPAGNTVTLYSGSTQVGSGVATGGNYSITTSSGFTAGTYSITATDTNSLSQTSVPSGATTLVVDTTSPVPTIAPVSPNPTPPPVSQLTINFTEPVYGLKLSALTLQFNSGANLLTTGSGATVTAANPDTNGGSATWTVGNLSSLTHAYGTYSMVLTAAGSGATDLAGNGLSGNASTSFTVVDPLSITGPTAAQTVKVSGSLTFNGSNGNAITLADTGFSGVVTLNLSVLHGTLAVSTSVAGGISASEVTNNGTSGVTVAAPLSQLQATLAATSGLTYTAGSSAGSDALSISASDTNGNTATLTPSVTISIAKATPLVSVADNGGTYNDAAFAASDTVAGVGIQSAPAASLESVTPSLSYFSGATTTGAPLSGAPTAVGTYTVLASFAGSADYTSASASSTFSISKATPFASVTDGGGTFTDAAFAATDAIAGVGSQSAPAASLEGVTPTLSYFAGTNTTGTALGAPPTTVGTYTAVASFAGSSDYNATSSGLVTLTIGRATPTVRVTDSSGTFNTAPFFAATTVAGAGSESTPAVSLEGVAPALTFYAGTATTGSALSGAPTAVGTYTALASFAGSTDYAAASSSTTFSISKAAPAISLTATSRVFNTAAFVATDTVAGVGSQSTPATSLEGMNPVLVYYSGTSTTGVALSGAPTVVGTYTALVSFAGSTDYGTANASSVFTISKAAPAVNVTDNSGTFNDAAFAATDTVSGVGSQFAATSSLEGVTPALSYFAGTSTTGAALSGAPSTAGTYSVLANFAGSTDYTGASSSTSFAIGQATAIVRVTDGGGTFSDAGFAATDTVAGVANQSAPASSLEGASPTLTYYSGTTPTGTPLSGAPTSVGTYTVLASFAGSTDYISANSTISFAISQATPTVRVTDGGGTFDNAAFPATDTVAGVGAQSAAATSLEGVTLALTYYSGTTVTGTSLVGAPTAVGTYTALASFAGSADYTTASASTQFTIANAIVNPPVVSVTDAGGIYNGAPSPATALVNGNPSLEGVTPTLTYFSGTHASGAALSSAPSAAGTYTVLGSFAGSTDFDSSSGSTTFIISPAMPSLHLTDGSGIYSGSAFAAADTVAGVGSQSAAAPSLEGVTPSLTYYSGTSVTGTPLSGAPAAAGTYMVLASFAPSADYTSASVSTTFTVVPATPTVHVTDAGGTFGAAAFSAADTVAGVGSQSTPAASLESVSPGLAYYSGASTTGTALSGAPTTVGTYTVLASFAGSSDYTSASSSTTFTVTLATPVVHVTDAGGTFSNAAFAAADTVAGVGSESAPAASLESASPSLTYYSGTSTTGTALSGAPSAVGTYAVLASFAGSTDYATANSSTTFTIGKATPSVSVTDSGGAFNGSAFAATCMVAGAGSQSAPTASLEEVSPSLTYYSGTAATGTALSGAPTMAGTYTVLASFGGSADYVTAISSTTFTISKATLTSNLGVTDSSGTFTGAAFSATDVIGGVGSESTPAASLEGVTPSLAYYSGTAATGTSLSGAPTGVGTYTVLASFAGSTDYTSTRASTTFTISAATPTVHVTDSGGTFTDAAFAATDTVAGVGNASAPGSSLEGVTPSLAYYSGTSTTGAALSGAPTTVGTYTVLAGFSGSADYTTANSSATFIISKATPAVSVTDAGATFNATAFSAADRVAGVGGQSTPAVSLEGVSPSLTYYSGTSTTGAALSGAPTAAGMYAVLASFGGSSDYATANASTTFTITPAMPTVHVTDAGGTFNAAAFGAADTVSGVGSESTPAAKLESVTPSLMYYSGTITTGAALSGAPTTAGTYTVLASFAGSTDYATANSSTLFTIGKATPTVSVTDSGGAFNGSAFAATSMVAGVGSESAPTASLEAVSPSLTYYSGTAATGTPLSGAPATSGTYTVLASFGGSTDYTTANNSTTFTISKATLTSNISVTDGSGTFTGAAFSAVDTIAGVGSESTPAASLEGVTPTLTYYSGTAATGTALSGAPTVVGTYTVLASFGGSTDYTNASASTRFTITPAAPTVHVTDSGGTFTAAAFAASDTVAGVGNESSPTPSLEGVTPSLTYYSGTSTTGAALSGAPTGAGTYTVLASFSGSADYTTASSGITFTVSKAAPAVSVTDAGGTFNAAAFAAAETVAGVGSESTPAATLESVSPSLAYYSGASTTGAALGGAPTTVGTYTVLASFGGSSDYISARSSTTFTITHATPNVGVVDDSAAFNGSAFTATVTIAGLGSESAPAVSLEGVTPSVAYYLGTAATGTALSGAPTAAGTYAALASFAGSTDYTSASGSTTFVIGNVKATPTISVTDGSGNFSGSAFAATGKIAGTGSESAPAVSLEGVSLSLAYYSGTTATGTVLSGAPTTSGTYTALASFAGSSDYTSASGSTTFVIGNTKATPSVSVSDGGGTFNGGAFSATDAIAGVGSESTTATSLEGVSLILSYYSGTSTTGTALGGAPTAAGTYTALASFAGSTDYTSASASTTFTITPATPTVHVTDAGGTFNNGAFAAAATVAGLGSQSTPATSLESVSPSLTYYSGSTATGTALSGAPTAVGTYTVLASFAGSTDYGTAKSSTIFTISKATPAVRVTDSGGTYNGSPFIATDTVAGVASESAPAASLESASPSLAYYSGTAATGTALSGAPTTAGTYTVLASFAGSMDYTSASSSTAVTIRPATPIVSVTDRGGTFNGSAFTATDTVAGNGSQSTPAASLESVSPSLTYYSGTTATGTALTSAPTAVGTYTVLASFAGSADYTSASSSTTLTISPATPTLRLTDNSGTFNGSAFTAAETVAGVGSESTPAASLESVSPSLTYYSGSTATGTALTGAPTAVGTYTVLASFAGSGDYTTASSSTSFTINPATPIVTVTDPGGVFKVAAFAATDTVAGVGSASAPAASLESVSPSLTYFSGTATTGAALSGAPSGVGTYTVLASFAGSGDYTTAGSSITFTITRATPIVGVTDSGGVSNGAAFAATDTVAGVGSESTPAASLEGASLSLTYYSGTNAAGSALSGAPSAVGTYTVLASFAGAIDYTSGAASTTFTITPAPVVGSISGNVFTDIGHNDAYVAGDVGLGDVTILLSGTSTSGTPENQSVKSGAGGTYSFSSVPAGTYNLTASYPAYLVPGIAIVGGGGGGAAVGQQISGVTVAAGSSDTDYDFSSYGLSRLVVTINLFLASTPPMPQLLNPQPSISPLLGQTVDAGTPTPVTDFTVHDPLFPVTTLKVSGTSSNTQLVPDANIVFAGSGTTRTIVVTPATGQSGTTTITATVSDGYGNTASTSFTLTVIGGAASTIATVSPAAAPATVSPSAAASVHPAVAQPQVAVVTPQPLTTTVPPVAPAVQAAVENAQPDGSAAPPVQPAKATAETGTATTVQSTATNVRPIVGPLPPVQMSAAAGPAAASSVQPAVAPTQPAAALVQPAATSVPSADVQSVKRPIGPLPLAAPVIGPIDRQLAAASADAVDQAMASEGNWTL